MSDERQRVRANWLPAPHFFNLNQACGMLVEAFGHCVYLVGSSLERRDYRDVDVRVILEDAEFDRLFPGAGEGPAWNPLWSVMCSAISLHLSQQSGLPVDFQIQRMTEANEKHPGGGGRRHPIGLFLVPVKGDATP